MHGDPGPYYIYHISYTRIYICYHIIYMIYITLIHFYIYIYIYIYILIVPHVAPPIMLHTIFDNQFGSLIQYPVKQSNERCIT